MRTNKHEKSMVPTEFLSSISKISSSSKFHWHSDSFKFLFCQFLDSNGNHSKQFYFWTSGQTYAKDNFWLIFRNSYLFLSLQISAIHEILRKIRRDHCFEATLNVIYLNDSSFCIWFIQNFSQSSEEASTLKTLSIKVNNLFLPSASHPWCCRFDLHKFILFENWAKKMI